MFSSKVKNQKLSPAVKKLSYLLSVLLISNVIFWSFFLEQTKSSPPTISFLDVGQGDSIFINSANHQQILIDGGPDNKILTKLTQKMPLTDKTIELMILTHPHEDHLTGLTYVLENYHVQKIIIPNLKSSPTLLNNFIALAKKNQSEIIFGHYPQKILLANSTLQILHPFSSDPQIVADFNDSSVVVLIEDKNKNQKILLTGDISKQVEFQLVKKYQQLLDVDILKIPHHGSDSASSQTFLETTSPQIAIISCGLNNQFHHPSQTTLDRLSQMNIQIHRTDLDHDLTLEF